MNEISGLGASRVDLKRSCEELGNEDQTGIRSVKVTYHTREDGQFSVEKKLELKKIHEGYQTALPVHFFHKVQGKSVPLKAIPQPPLTLSLKSNFQSDLLIVEAISSGNLEGFRKLLAKRFDLRQNINKTVWGPDEGLTCLYWAIKAKQLDIVQYLVEEKHAEVEVSDNLEDGWMPAIIVSLKESPDDRSLAIVEYLAERDTGCLNTIFYSEEGAYGPFISSCEQSWTTPVGYYSVVGDLDRLRVLGELGADLDLVDDEGRTPVARTIRALIDDQEEDLIHGGLFLASTANYLIEHGVDFKGEGQDFLAEISSALADDTISEERSLALRSVYKTLKKRI